MPESETREIAVKLAMEFSPYGFPSMWGQKLADAIDEALRQRDERAARIAESHEGHGDWCSSASGDCQSLTVKAIAAAIRRSDSAGG